MQGITIKATRVVWDINKKNNAIMREENIKIQGMTCNHCVKSVESALRALPVEKYEVKIGSTYVEYDPVKLTKEQITDSIEDIGYEIINNI
jgi:copper chaperone